MEGPVLDAEELAAIRRTIDESRPRKDTSAPAVDATPIPLIADDRAAERARPDGLKLGRRWASILPRRIARACGAKLMVESIGAEIVNGPSLREELASSWIESLRPIGREGLALCAVSGPLVEGLSVRLIGAAAEDSVADRPPSPIALKLFTPVGQAIGAALGDAWRDEQACEVRAEPNADAVLRDLAESDVVIAITLELGPPSGRVRLLARPETLVIPAPPVKVVPAPPGAIEAALGAVPLQVRVELGTISLTMTQLAALKPGDVISLHQEFEGFLPVRCGGVVKAHGRPMVVRDAMAVEIADPKETKK